MKIDDIVKEELELNNYNPENYRLLRQINNIVFYNGINHQLDLKVSNMSLEKSYKHSYNFLKSIKKEYADYLEMRKQEGTLELDKTLNDNDAYSFYDIETNSRCIHIPVLNTIEDSYTITHEIMHDMNASDNIIRIYFTETISLIAEFLQNQYFKNRNTKDYNKVFFNSLVVLDQFSKEIDLQLDLLNYGYKNKKINLNDFFNETKNKGHFQQRKKIINEIIESESMDIEIPYRYTLALVLSAHYINKYKQDPYKLVLLNENINKMQIHEPFKLLDINLDIDKSGIYLPKEQIEELDISYKKIIKER